LKAVPPQLTPKKARGAPPSIASPASKSTSSQAEKDSKATLTPVRRMTPLKIHQPDAEDEEESTDES
tara:strand:- start:2394 stop:2594 length:201 start_codon:yes stop_codon:yes gene_type:complete